MSALNFSLIKNIFHNAKSMMIRYFWPNQLLNLSVFRKLNKSRSNIIKKKKQSLGMLHQPIKIIRFKPSRRLMNSITVQIDRKKDQRKYKKIRKENRRRNRIQTQFDNQLPPIHHRFVNQEGESLSSISAKSELLRQVDQNQRKQISKLICGDRQKKQKQTNIRSTNVHYISPLLSQEQDYRIKPESKNVFKKKYNDCIINANALSNCVGTNSLDNCVNKNKNPFKQYANTNQFKNPFRSIGSSNQFGNYAIANPFESKENLVGNTHLRKYNHFLNNKTIQDKLQEIWQEQEQADNQCSTSLTHKNQQQNRVNWDYMD